MVGPSRLVIVLGLALSLFGASACDRPPVLTNIGGVDTLQRQFNADAGKPRVVLLLSPT